MSEMQEISEAAGAAGTSEAPAGREGGRVVRAARATRDVAGMAPHGMLFVASNVDAADEDDFNQWYDREHVEERARIRGFISAARYEAVQGGPKYLGLYRTESLAVFTSAAYQAAFGRQTPWSVTNLGRMRQPMRRVSEVAAAVGQGSGSWLAVLPLAQPEDAPALVDQVAEAGGELSSRPGFVHSYLLMPDAALSQPLPRESMENRQLLPILVIETSSEAAGAAALRDAAGHLRACGADAANAARYALKWKLFSQEVA
ncbi:hypothetical protein ACKI2N_029215 [Cupriavidus sp. 30B13]|uniref:hypothetical protein n=1 Tax=Cupriavidus sp. 30B13 TaxID=3384241 RepID=UPI003B904A73